MLKKLPLLFIPLMLVGCNSNPTSTANYIRLQSFRISGGSEITNSEPVYYVFAEYELAEAPAEGSTFYVYGEARKTIYVMASFTNYENYGFKSQAGVTLYDYYTGTQTNTTATFKGEIVKSKVAQELYYSVEIRTIKQVYYYLATDKTYNNSKLNELKNKGYYSANLTESSTTITVSNSYSNGTYQPKTTETYTDLGTTAVTYVPYTPPEN